MGKAVAEVVNWFKAVAWLQHAAYPHLKFATNRISSFVRFSGQLVDHICHPVKVKRSVWSVCPSVTVFSCRSDEPKSAGRVLTTEEQEDGEVHLAESEPKSQPAEPGTVLLHPQMCLPAANYPTAELVFTFACQYHQ